MKRYLGTMLLCHGVVLLCYAVVGSVMSEQQYHFQETTTAKSPTHTTHTQTQPTQQLTRPTRPTQQSIQPTQQLTRPQTEPLQQKTQPTHPGRKPTKFQHRQQFHEAVKTGCLPVDNPATGERVLVIASVGYS